MNVVAINGGRGAATLIPELLRLQGVNVVSVVNAYDDGKSTGEIRRLFGMLGPSDIRKVQELMLPEDDPEYETFLRLFRFRFPQGSDRAEVLASLGAFRQGTSDQLAGQVINSIPIRVALQRYVGQFLDGMSVIEKARGERLSFNDCSLMNCIFAGAFLYLDRNFESATRHLDRLFKMRGTVLPTSIENKTLVALRENGEMLYSEAEIVELRSNVRIERIFLLDSVPDRSLFDRLSIEDKRSYLEHSHCFVEVSPGVRTALRDADIIIFAAGTQHSSLYPTYLSRGLAEAIVENRGAFKVFVTNIGADYETPTYRASDYIRGAHRYLEMAGKRSYGMGDLFDVNLINKSHLKRDSTYVEFDEAECAALPVPMVVDAFESEAADGRHDGSKVVGKILALYDEALARR